MRPRPARRRLRRADAPPAAKSTRCRKARTATPEGALRVKRWRRASRNRPDYFSDLGERTRRRRAATSANEEGHLRPAERAEGTRLDRRPSEGAQRPMMLAIQQLPRLIAIAVCRDRPRHWRTTSSRAAAAHPGAEEKPFTSRRGLRRQWCHAGRARRSRGGHAIGESQSRTRQRPAVVTMETRPEVQDVPNGRDRAPAPRTAEGHVHPSSTRQQVARLMKKGERIPARTPRRTSTPTRSSPPRPDTRAYLQL